MATNYNVNPYYDDFDETKQFYRILFRPGRAVQARELTQIQTNIQKQIERFGQSIFKEGSIVIPGGFSLDRKHHYVKLTTSYGTNVSDSTISTLVNRVITGANSNVTAIVVDTAISTTAGDPPTLYVQYLSSNTTANATNTRFQSSELIVNDVGNLTLQVANTSNVVGFGTIFTIGSGAVFTRGVFAYHDAQRYIASKYTQANNVVLGFQVTESTTTATDDTSLLDPAVGASNYIAPGADRYKIALDLSHRDLPFTADQDPDFVELVRVEDGEIIKDNLDPQYSILGDTLARRTFDESGDYTVRPYNIQIKNHLRSSNTDFDGYFVTSDGGDDDLFVGLISPGKAYVKGYEIQGVSSKYITGNKARNYANVNNAVVSTTIGNYIYITNLHSVPDIANLGTLSLYNEYNTSGGTSNGTLVGTAKVRGIEFYSGTPGNSDAQYRLWLFDVTMESGYVFERDVKQIYADNVGFDDFTADIVPTLTAITGSVSLTSGEPTVDGTATRFTTELKNGDYITVNSETFRVGNVNSSIQITANSSATGSINGVFALLNTVSYNDTEHLPHLFEMPNQVIRSVDPTNVETIYDVKRTYSRTLSANAVTITSGTDEIFAGVSTTNYTIFITSGTHAGNIVSPTSVITRGGSPTGKNITIDLTSLGAGYATEDIIVIAKLAKTNSAADKKSKTLQANTTIDYVDANTAQATTISLAKADVLNVVSVYMSTASFGSAYSASGAVDITSRYTVDTGQRLTYYDVGSIVLKPNQPKPTGPIRITFNYFTHGAGDYFSVDSYDIPYDDIPSFNSGSKIYQLRDCLDFRPRINDAGTGFTGTGATVNDFIDPSSDVVTDYSYYLPRTDIVVLNRDGQFRIVQGVDSLTPQRPTVPDDSMLLFVLEQDAYVFDVANNIKVTKIDNRRYTMRDIGKIETRVKNLEYYTLLNLLERDTQALQVQDADGFDKFKNGFIVDNFSGHGIGDVYNRDYGVAIDEERRELRPITETQPLPLIEFIGANTDPANTTTLAARTANNYVYWPSGIISLPYTHTEYIKSSKASTTENINPFSLITWSGTITLSPSSDKWFDTQRKPDLYTNEEGNFDHLAAEAAAKGLFNMNWGSWRNVGGLNIERTGTSFEVVEQVNKRVEKDVIVSTSFAPKMRSVSIGFRAEGLKPGTRVYVYFDNINVTPYCTAKNSLISLTASNALLSVGPSVLGTVTNNGFRTVNLITDQTGKIDGVFNYDADVFNLPIGEKSFRISSSVVNDSSFETLAEAIFTSSGEIQFVRDEYTSTRNGTLVLKTIIEKDTLPPPPPPPTPLPDTEITVNPGVIEDEVTSDPPKNDDEVLTPILGPDFIDLVYGYGLGRLADRGGKTYWFGKLSEYAAGTPYSTIEGIAAAATVSSTGPLDGDYNIDALSITDTATGGVGANDATAALFQMAYTLLNGRKGQGGTEGDGDSDIRLVSDFRKALTNKPGGRSSLVGAQLYNIGDELPGDYMGQARLANSRAAKQIAYGIAAVNSGYVPSSVVYYDDCISATLKPASARPIAIINPGAPRCVGTGKDPLAQSFFVDRGLFLTKVDLFFSEKDNTIPMRIELRKMVNGLPGSFTIPLSNKVVYPEDITTTSDGSTPTTISWDAPIFLEPGEYALVLLAETTKYRVWISQIGQRDIITNSIISEQPYIGVLFKSQNASTWTPDQYQDLKFTLYRAAFDVTVTGAVEFTIPTGLYGTNLLEGASIEVSPNSNIARIYSPRHGQNSGSYISLTGLPTENTFGVNSESTIVGIGVDLLEDVPFVIANTTLDSFTITLPGTVSDNVTSTSRIVNEGVTISRDIVYDTYVPIIPSLRPSGTFIVNKIKTTRASDYTLGTTFSSIKVGEVDFNETKLLASVPNKQQLMSNSVSFLHKVEMITQNEFLSPIIDTEAITGLFVKNVINNPTYDNSNFTSANDIVTIASNTTPNILVTQVSTVNAQGIITFTDATDITNAAGIIQGTYLNITSNTAVGTGQYRVIEVRDSGANVAVYNLSGVNVSTMSSDTSLTITNGRNFIAEEAPFDGSAYSKYITRQVDFVNPSDSFKFFVDVVRPSGSNIKFYYKISEVGDTIDLKDKEYTEITDVTLPTTLNGSFSEVSKLVDNLPQFDAIVFKIVFLSDDGTKVPKCKDLRIIALV